MIFMGIEMLKKADILSNNNQKIKITTIDGRVLFGVSWGIQPATDPETGDELDYSCLAFMQDNGEYDELTNEEIKSVEKA